MIHGRGPSTFPATADLPRGPPGPCLTRRRSPWGPTPRLPRGLPPAGPGSGHPAEREGRRRGRGRPGAPRQPPTIPPLAAAASHREGPSGWPAVPLSEPSARWPPVTPGGSCPLSSTLTCCFLQALRPQRASKFGIPRCGSNKSLASRPAPGGRPAVASKDCPPGSFPGGKPSPGKRRCRPFPGTIPLPGGTLPPGAISAGLPAGRPWAFHGREKSPPSMIMFLSYPVASIAAGRSATVSPAGAALAKSNPWSLHSLKNILPGDETPPANASPACAPEAPASPCVGCCVSMPLPSDPCRGQKMGDTGVSEEI